VLITATLEGKLTDAQAEQLAGLNSKLQKLAWLAAVKRIAELKFRLNGREPIDPATPSGQQPIYTKPQTSQHKKKPGAKTGHPGSWRAKPQRIDRTEEYRQDCCPDCGETLHRCKRKRIRTTNS